MRPIFSFHTQLRVRHGTDRQRRRDRQRPSCPTLWGRWHKRCRVVVSIDKAVNSLVATVLSLYLYSKKPRRSTCLEYRLWHLSARDNILSRIFSRVLNLRHQNFEENDRYIFQRSKYYAPSTQKISPDYFHNSKVLHTDIQTESIG